MGIQGFPSKTNVIKSIQRGQTIIPEGGTTNVTITAVDLDKTFISTSMGMFRASSTTRAGSIYVYLTSTTNLAVTTVSEGPTTSDDYVGWEVIEYE